MNEPYIEKDAFGRYILHIGTFAEHSLAFTESELKDLKTAIDLILKNEGMINCHSWNGAIIIDSNRLEGLYGISANSLGWYAEKMYKNGKHKTVSVWQCIKTFGAEDTVKECEEDEEDEEDYTTTVVKSNTRLEDFI